MNRLPRAPAAFLAALALAASVPAGAQYIYLDSNGDGVHTDADVLAPTGTTTFDVWLRTDHDRDGTSVACVDGTSPLTMMSYQFILHAENGTVTYGTLTNRRPEFGSMQGTGSNAVDLYVGYGTRSLAPGTYRLASIEVTPATGTPALDFAASTPLESGAMTGFGSDCPGPSYLYMLLFGSDWFDADGAAYGGTANHAPSLDPIADVTVPEGMTMDVGVTATDLDGQPLTFTLLSGPSYATLTTTDPGTGTGTAEVHLAPGYADAGTATATVSVTDGIGSDSRAFGITVTNTDRAPVLVQPANMMPFEGSSMAQILNATDPDRDALNFYYVGGPAWITVTTEDVLAARGTVHLTPGPDDAGDYTATVGVTDGSLSDKKSFMIMVRNLNRPPVITVPGAQMVEEGVILTFAVTAMDPDMDPLTLAATALPDGATIADHGNGSATFTWVPGFDQAGSYALEFVVDDGLGKSASGTVDVTVSDVTRAVALAQPLDMAVIEGATASQMLRAYDASGDPLTFEKVSGPAYLTVTTTMPGAGLAQGLVELAPGYSDAGSATAVVAATDGTLREERSFSITVADAGGAPLPGQPPFVPPFPMLAVGMTPHTVTMGDVNGDGIRDLAVAALGSNLVSILLGRGDGTFGMRADYPTMMMPHTVVIRDLNGDGHPDLTVSNMGSSAIGTLMGNGDGTFQMMRTFMMMGAPMYVGVDDFDGDGIPDAVATNRTAGALTVFRGAGDGTFAPVREIPTGADAHGLVIGDVDRDGHPDVVVANPGPSTVSVLLGKGDLTFRAMPDFETPAPHTLSLGDLNGDGDVDLCVVNYDDNSVTICMGHGDGVFTPVETIPTGMHAHGSIIGDVDGDRAPDLLVANEGAGTLSVLMGHGDGTFAPKVDFAMDGGSHSVDIGDLNGDGLPDLAVSNIFASTVRVLLNRRAPMLHARAWTSDADQTLRLMLPHLVWKVHVEPMDGSFGAADVIPASLCLISKGMGSVMQIHAMAGKSQVAGDHDGNGVEDLEAAFAGEDLLRMFGKVRGQAVISAGVQGDCADGGRFQAPITIRVIFAPGQQKKLASVAPNPLNPSAMLSFTTERPGPVTVRIYDLFGRLVRTLLDGSTLPAGPHTLRIDGRDARGARLASGVYFFRVLSPDGEASGRFAVLK